jgi:hypothetical protein
LRLKSETFVDQDSMTDYLVFDCEIKKCIPDRNGVMDANLDYCEGWNDYDNMGVSVVGVQPCGWSAPIAWVDEAYTGKDSWVRRDQFDRDGTEALCPATVFRQPSLNQWFEANDETVIIGFNSKNFDDKLLQANGINIKTDYDLLEEIRLAAFGSTRYQDTPKGCGYTLGKIAEANGFSKTGSGDLAPVLWQQGRYEEVIKYCLNDVKITHELLLLGWAGRLVDPNTGKKLRTRSLDEVMSNSVAPL